MFFNRGFRNSVLLRDRMFQPWLWRDWVYNLFPSAKEYNSGVNRLHKFTKEVRVKTNANIYVHYNNVLRYIGRI